MRIKNYYINDNISIHKFIIERDINNINLIKCNQFYYNLKNKNILDDYNNEKRHYDKKYNLLKNDIQFFDLKYKKMIYHYNRLNNNNFNIDYDILLNDRQIHYDILTNNHKQYFNKNNVDDFLRIYFDIYLEIKKNYFGNRYI